MTFIPLVSWTFDQFEWELISYYPIISSKLVKVKGKGAKKNRERTVGEEEELEGEELAFSLVILEGEVDHFFHRLR